MTKPHFYLPTDMKKSLVWQLLRRNISVGQIAGYAVANLLGLAIVLTAVQFYRDVTEVWNDEDSFISRDYIIISKKVDGVISFSPEESSFSQEEIDDINAQPWTRKTGRFTAAGYNVAASLDFWGRGMSTALFFESIPDEFFDVKPDGWEWAIDSLHPERPLPEIPVIISKDYLTLYNFGFAASRGYPQVSESTIGSIPVNISISGNGRQARLTGRIVGFSQRLNTFAVPENFMNWANSNFSEKDADTRPSRLIIEVNTPGDPTITKYLEEHDYESAGDKADNGRAAYFLSVLTAVVIGVGAMISLLAFFILLLSIYLLLQKNREKLRMLMMLGYSPRQVSACYFRIVAIVNGVILLGAIVLMLVAQTFWRSALAEIGVEIGSPWLSILVGFLLIAAITAGNFAAIGRNVRSTFPRPGR